ncbi:M35 family metallo-endopeptidase [Arenimonas oryziterrae]|uniref:Lysine-specific metallo-endopeptidase domain-containing protein n=1 Tax=Arenimonas oryziterrae DSM 21050 = YC6267 TaxID=1121015 RepID=A0A091AUH1_9GAMM|nr:M35 family metallo-endopeptidase [Arenimonas oryziterrae]KFN42877.1 hypothetical protein N789_12165 [Arenimonas oryziterrae DSM 21050 = YC6267]
MSNTFRNVWLAAGLVAVAGSAFAVRQEQEPSLENPVAVSMYADASSTEAFMGTVEFKITNTSRETLRIPYWQLPTGQINSDLFEVFHKGERVEYVGPMIKRAAPTEGDLVTLQPGETRVVRADLSTAYDLSATGEYDIRFKSYLQGAKTGRGRAIARANGGLSSIETAPLRLWVDGANVLGQIKKGDSASVQAKPGATATCTGGTCYESCSATRQTQLATALNSARNYSENAKGYLNLGTVGARYTTWFGAYTSSRYGTVKSHFVNIDSTLDTKTITFNCSCTTKNTYAYVYPNQPYRIYLCGAFWTAPNTGTDSRAGTIIHETSHFDIVANTDDVVYGQSGAKSLAISNPNDAIRNADSHEYLSENTPSQN